MSFITPILLHKSSIEMSFYRLKINNPTILAKCVSDFSRVAYTPTPSPYLHSSLSLPLRFLGFWISTSMGITTSSVKSKKKWRLTTHWKGKDRTNLVTRVRGCFVYLPEDRDKTKSNVSWRSPSCSCKRKKYYLSFLPSWTNQPT